jgi:hypothetical protein
MFSTALVRRVMMPSLGHRACKSGLKTGIEDLWIGDDLKGSCSRIGDIDCDERLLDKPADAQGLSMRDRKSFDAARNLVGVTGANAGTADCGADHSVLKWSKSFPVIFWRNCFLFEKINAVLRCTKSLFRPAADLVRPFCRLCRNRYSIVSPCLGASWFEAVLF